jgi:hypothetical protein
VWSTIEHDKDWKGAMRTVFEVLQKTKGGGT